MWLVADKTRGYALVALAAGGWGVGRRDLGLGIGGLKNFVRAMATPASCRGNETEFGHLAVESIAVALQPRLVTVAAGGDGFELPVHDAHLGNLMRGMAIRAYRSIRAPGDHRLAVRSGKVSDLDAGMARATGGRHISREGPAFRVLSAEDIVRPMATGAGGGHQQPVAGQGEAVNRIHVKRVHVRKAIFLGNLGVSVARAAGARQVERVDSRLRVSPGAHAVGVSVTIEAARKAALLLPLGDCVNAARVARSCVGVAAGARNRLDRIGMRKGTDVSMAGDTPHRRMDRRLVYLRIDVHANRPRL